MGQKGKGSEEKRRGQKIRNGQESESCLGVFQYNFFCEIVDSGHNFCAVLLVMKTEFLQDN